MQVCRCKANACSIVTARQRRHRLELTWLGFALLGFFALMVGRSTFILVTYSARSYHTSLAWTKARSLFDHEFHSRSVPFRCNILYISFGCLRFVMILILSMTSVCWYFYDFFDTLRLQNDGEFFWVMLYNIRYMTYLLYWAGAERIPLKIRIVIFVSLHSRRVIENFNSSLLTSLMSSLSPKPLLFIISPLFFDHNISSTYQQDLWKGKRVVDSYMYSYCSVVVESLAILSSAQMMMFFLRDALCLVDTWKGFCSVHVDVEEACRAYIHWRVW